MKYRQTYNSNTALKPNKVAALNVEQTKHFLKEESGFCFSCVLVI